jgi:hypothetical protein
MFSSLCGNRVVFGSGDLRRISDSCSKSLKTLLACLYLAAAHVSLPAATDLDVRVLRLEQWLKAVLHHQPGTTDESVRAIGSWSIDELNTLAIDQGVLIQLTQNLTQLTTTTRAFSYSGRPEGFRIPRGNGAD